MWYCACHDVGEDDKEHADTIGRVRHLLAHVAAQLPGLAAGADTFEEIRDRYAQTIDRAGQPWAGASDGAALGGGSPVPLLELGP